MVGSLKSFLSQRHKGPLLGGAVRRSVATLLGGTAAAQFIAFAASPALSRLYTPEIFGIAAVFTAALGLLTILATLRFELAIPLAAREEQADVLLGICLGNAAVFAATLALANLLFQTPPASFKALESIWPYRWLLPPLVLFCGAYQALYHTLLRAKNYRVLAQSRIRQALAGTGGSLALGLAQVGALGMIIGTSLGQCAGALLLWRNKPNRPVLNRGRIFEEWNRNGNFALFTTVAALLNSSGTLLPPVLITAIYTEETAGHFALATRIMGLPMALLGTAVAQVFYSEAVSLLATSPSQVPQFFSKVTRKMILASGLLLFIGVLSPFVFQVIFGAGWAEAGQFAALLTIASCAQLIVSPVSQIVLLLKRQGVQLVLDIFRVVIVFVSLVVPSRYGVSPIGSVAYYSIGMLILYAASYCVYQRLVGSIPPPTVA